MVTMLRRGFSCAWLGFVDHGCAIELAMWGCSALRVKLYALHTAQLKLEVDKLVVAEAAPRRVSIQNSYNIVLWQTRRTSQRN